MGYSWPLPADTPVTQPFGSSPGGYNPVGGHTGTDLAPPYGSPVYAPGKGVITFAREETDPYGNDNPYLLTSFGGKVVVLDCGEVAFVFAHLSAFNVNVGDQIDEGEVIAWTGNSGTATTGTHLHFEALPDGWNIWNGTWGRVSPALYCDNYNAVNGPAQAVGPNQRVTGPDGVRGRSEAFVSDPIDANVVQKFAGNLVLTFKGFVHGQNVQGNDVWFVGFSSGAYFWSGGFEDQSTANLPDLTPAPTPAPADDVLLPYQRVTGPSGATLRKTPDKNGAVDKTFPADRKLDFKGYVHDTDPYGDGNDVWFVGRYSNSYAWSGAFLDTGTHDLPDLTPTNAPIPSSPPVEAYDFKLDFDTIIREDGVAIQVQKVPADIGNVQIGNPTAKYDNAVIHQFGTPDVDTQQSTDNQFKNPGTFVSAHWSVSGRTIHQHVALNDRAYHAASVGNDYIGIETDPHQDAETVATVRALLSVLRAQGMAKQLWLHRNVPGCSTNCGALIDLARYDVTPGVIITPSPNPIPDPVPVTPEPAPVGVDPTASVMDMIRQLLEWLLKVLGIKK